MSARRFLAPRVTWDAVIFVQRARCAPLDAWFTHFPLLGNEAQYVLLLPALGWFLEDGGTARRFLLISFVSCMLANATKDLLRLPRPPRTLHVCVDEHVAQQFGFPSTHSAHAISQAWLLAREALLFGANPAIFVWGLAAAHTVHVCTSRLYLGVHSLADVVGGLSVGTLCIALLEVSGREADAFTVHSGTGQLLAVAGTLGALACCPDRRHTNTAFTELLSFAGLYLGACLGTGSVGHALGLRAHPDPDAPLGTLLLQFIAGLVALAVVRTAASAAAKAAVRLLPPPLVAPAVSEERSREGPSPSRPFYVTDSR